MVLISTLSTTLLYSYLHFTIFHCLQGPWYNLSRVIDHSTRLICRKFQVGEVIDSKWSMNQLKLPQVLYCIQRGKNSPTGKSALLIIIRNDTIFIYFNCLISKENTRSINCVIHTIFRFLTRGIFLVHLP